MYIIGISKHFVPKVYAWCSSKPLLIWKFYLFDFLDKKCPNTSQLHTKSVRYFCTPVKIKLIYYFITSMFEFVSNCSNIYFQSYYSEISPSYYLKYSVHKSSEESFRQEKKTCRYCLFKVILQSISCSLPKRFSKYKFGT